MQTFLIISNILLWICMITLLFGFFYLARMVGEFLNRFRVEDNSIRAARLERGQTAPPFRELSQRRETVRLSDHGGRVSAVLFKSSSCATCQEISAQLQRLGETYPDLNLLVIDRDAGGEWDKALPPNVHLLLSDDLFKTYFVDKVPHLFLVAPNGIILQSEKLRSLEHLMTELERATVKAS